MIGFKQKLLAWSAFAGVTLLTATASAAPTLVGVFSVIKGNDCSDVNGCAAYHIDLDGVAEPGEGVFEPGRLSPTPTGASKGIAKFDGALSLATTSWPSIEAGDFDEFSFSGTLINLIYTPDDASDPEIHYFSVKQAQEYALYYDPNPITLLDDFDVSGIFNGISHVTLFNTGCTANCNPPTNVPEPATLALFGAGLMGLGLLRRRRSV